MRVSLVNCTEHLEVGDFFAPSPDSMADLRSYHRGSFGPLISLWLGLETGRAVAGNFWVLRPMLCTVVLWEIGRRDESMAPNVDPMSSLINGRYGHLLQKVVLDPAVSSALLLFLSSASAMSHLLLRVRNVGLGKIPPIFVLTRR